MSRQSDRSGSVAGIDRDGRAEVNCRIGKATASSYCRAPGAEQRIGPPVTVDAGSNGVALLNADGAARIDLPVCRLTGKRPPMRRRS